MDRAVAAVIVILLLLSSAGAAFSSDEPTLSFRSSGSEIRFDSVTEGELTSSLLSYVTACRRFEDVVREGEQHSDLRRLWVEQEPLTHAVLGADFGEDAPSHLRNRSVEILVGLDASSGPAPVLYRESSGEIGSLIKCPGLEGLLLTCRVHSLVPGLSPDPDCARWREIQRVTPSQPSAPPAE